MKKMWEGQCSEVNIAPGRNDCAEQTRLVFLSHDTRNAHAWEKVRVRGMCCSHSPSLTRNRPTNHQLWENFIIRKKWGSFLETVQLLSVARSIRPLCIICSLLPILFSQSGHCFHWWRSLQSHHQEWFDPDDANDEFSVFLQQLAQFWLNHTKFCFVSGTNLSYMQSRSFLALSGTFHSSSLRFFAISTASWKLGRFLLGPPIGSGKRNILWAFLVIAFSKILAPCRKYPPVQCSPNIWHTRFSTLAMLTG